MKKLLLVTICLFGITLYGTSQDLSNPSDTIQVILENDKMIVTEYVSTAGKDVCGKGKHSHVPHLSIFLSDAKVKLTTNDGKTQDFDLKAGTTFWSEAETHMAINNGKETARVYLIELK